MSEAATFPSNPFTPGTAHPPDRAADIIERLHEVGFVWQITKDTADNWEAGIPSLMGYTLAKQGDR